MDEAGGYDQQDAQGFIRINAVRLKNHTHMKRKSGAKKSKAA
jgi:argininosuccinate synthase